MTPQELADWPLSIQLLELLNRTDEWPLIAVADALAQFIEARDKALADDFRRLAAEAWGKTEDVPANGGLSAEDAVHHDATAQAFTQAAQMVEEKLT